MNDRAFWLAWTKVPGVGPTLLMRLYRYFGCLEAAWQASVKELCEVEGFGPMNAEAAAAGRSPLDPYALLDEHLQTNPNFWTPVDPDYPKLLLEIPDPPPLLYFRGVVEQQENEGTIPAIAIVGTRSPSEYGRKWTARISTALVKAGFSVVSGLAQGIDTVAHVACLQASGRTIAVMGTGTNIVYPLSNRKLAQRIAAEGLLLSEHPAGTQADRAHFPRRNRIIAGLSRAVLVLEAPQQSGALITARVANDYGRDVYALPGSLDNEQSRGCLELLNQGAQMILSEDHLLELLGNLPNLLPRSPGEQLSLLNAATPELTPNPTPNLPPDLQQVLHHVPLEPIAVDIIVQRSGLATAAVLSALAQLELMGLVSQLPGMRYQQ